MPGKQNFDEDQRTLLRFLSSSPLASGSSSSSRSAVSVGLRICAMLPLLVGGPELSLMLRFLFSRPAEFHDQLLKLSMLTMPLENGGGGGGVEGRERDCGFVAAWRE